VPTYRWFNGFNVHKYTRQSCFCLIYIDCGSHSCELRIVLANCFWLRLNRQQFALAPNDAFCPIPIQDLCRNLYWFGERITRFSGTFIAVRERNRSNYSSLGKSLANLLELLMHLENEMVSMSMNQQFIHSEVLAYFAVRLTGGLNLDNLIQKMSKLPVKKL